VRLADLPVTQDEALRRRLNALVTTGDESGTADTLAAKLKDLKNRCRYNKSGLLPEAEAELAALERKIQDLSELKRQEILTAEQLTQTEKFLDQLLNHQAALRFEGAKEDAARIEETQSVYQMMTERLKTAEQKCAALPSREIAEEKLRLAGELQQQWLSVQMEDRILPDAPQPPEPVAGFDGIPVDMLQKQVNDDYQRYEKLKTELVGKPTLPWVLGALGVLGIVLCLVLSIWGGVAISAVVLVAGVVLLNTDRNKKNQINQQLSQLAERYRNMEPEQWQMRAEAYLNKRHSYEQQLQTYRETRSNLDQRYKQIGQALQELTLGSSVEVFTGQWQQIVAQWNEYEDARGDQQQVKWHLDSIRQMARTAEPPTFADTLDMPEEQTMALITEHRMRQRQLQDRLSKLQGTMAAVGEEQILQEQARALRERITELEAYYAALTLAQQTLMETTEQLQRRFAPRIAERARVLFGAVTDGRYDRLNLTRELAVNAGAEGETTLHSAQWRSEGTADQMYVALRLAVAEELTPAAPLVLDDALVRFDDRRLKNILALLQQMAHQRQILLFTCQGREKALTE
jgi:outer membrane murein-binding lipoprotein Lpp